MPSHAPQASPLRLALQLLLPLAVLAMAVLVRPAQGASAQTSSEGNVRLSPAMSTVAAGDGPFTVYVVLEALQHAGNVTYDDNRDGIPDRSVPSAGLGAFQFTIEYDPAIVEFQSVERGPNLGLTGRSFQCLPAIRDIGTVTFGCLSPGTTPAGAQGTLTLASVQFSPRSNGLSPLVLAAEIAGPLGDSADVDVGGGAARVYGGSPPGGSTRLPTSATNTPGAPATDGTPLATITTTSVEQATATAVAQKTIAAGGTPGQTPTVFVKGQPGTPDPENTLGSKGDGGSGNHLWLWSLVFAAALGCGVIGLTAMLWRHRGHEGL